MTVVSPRSPTGRGSAGGFAGAVSPAVGAREAEVGVKPRWAAEAFRAVDEDLRQSVKRILANPVYAQISSSLGVASSATTASAGSLSSATV